MGSAMTSSRSATIARTASTTHEQSADRKQIFNIARNRWLGRLARDPELSGSAVRVAILLWDKFNAKHGGAWPSIAYMARTLTMHRSTVIRAVNTLEEHDWLDHRSGKSGRCNFYSPRFGKFDDETKIGDAKEQDAFDEVVAAPQRVVASPQQEGSSAAALTS
jgi:hypothetical protein